MSESQNQYQEALSHQYEMMIRGEYSDFSIVVEGKLYHVHKLVLATRSPYFETLFSTEMKETAEKKLELSDIDVEIFEMFLKYVYTCEISDLEKHAEKLLLCGEKYQMDELVKLCEVSLIKTLNIKNAASCLLLGHLLMRQKLKSHSLLFIWKNWDAVMNTEGWENVIYNHTLMTELESKLFSETTNRTPVGSIKSSHRERKWVFGFSEARLPELCYFHSPTFTLSDEEVGGPWRFTAQSENHKLTLSLIHVGMHVTVPPIFCSISFKRSNSSTIASCAVETTCCFDAKSVCRKPLIACKLGDYDPSQHQEIEFSVQMSILKTKSDISFQQPLINYFHEYLENSCFTDAIIDLKGEMFSVHKIILSASSPVFAEIFNTKKERYQLKEDVEPQTFREMLALIYTNGDTLKNADLSLLESVDRFRLNEKLRNRCRAAIMRNMNNDNAMDILIHSETSGDMILKQMVLKYVCKNFLIISTLPSWGTIKDHPYLHGVLLRFMTSRLRDFS